MGDAFDGGEAHVLGVVFQTRDGGLGGAGAPGEVFLRDARMFARLPEQDAHLEFLIAAFQVVGEFAITLFAAADVFVEIVFHRFAFRFT